MPAIWPTQKKLPKETRQRFAGSLKERLHELEHQVRDMLVFARGELPLGDRMSPKALFRRCSRQPKPMSKAIACAGNATAISVSCCAIATPW